MKTVNAHKRRVNSRRVGGAVHRECLICRVKDMRGQVCQNPSEIAEFVRPPSSTVIGESEMLVSEFQWAQCPDGCSSSANTEGFVHPTWHAVAKRCRWSVQLPLSPRFLVSLISLSRTTRHPRLAKDFSIISTSNPRRLLGAMQSHIPSRADEVFSPTSCSLTHCSCRGVSGIQPLSTLPRTLRLSQTSYTRSRTPITTG